MVAIVSFTRDSIDVHPELKSFRSLDAVCDHGITYL